MKEREAKLEEVSVRGFCCGPMRRRRRCLRRRHCKQHTKAVRAERVYAIYPTLINRAKLPLHRSAFTATLMLSTCRPTFLPTLPARLPFWLALKSLPQLVCPPRTLSTWTQHQMRASKGPPAALVAALLLLAAAAAPPASGRALTIMLGPPTEAKDVEGEPVLLPSDATRKAATSLPTDAQGEPVLLPSDAEKRAATGQPPAGTFGEPPPPPAPPADKQAERDRKLQAILAGAVKTVVCA